MSKEKVEPKEIMSKEERAAIAEVFEEVRRNSSYKSTYVPKFLKSIKARHFENAKAKSTKKGKKR